MHVWLVTYPGWALLRVIIINISISPLHCGNVPFSGELDQVTLHSHPPFGTGACKWACGLNCVPQPNSYVELLTPSSSECDLIWRQGFMEVIK